MEKVVAAGASAFIVKQAIAEDLLPAIKSAVAIQARCRVTGRLERTRHTHRNRFRVVRRIERGTLTSSRSRRQDWSESRMFRQSPRLAPGR